QPLHRRGRTARPGTLLPTAVLGGAQLPRRGGPAHPHAATARRRHALTAPAEHPRYGARTRSRPAVTAGLPSHRNASGPIGKHPVPSESIRPAHREVVGPPAYIRR